MALTAAQSVIVMQHGSMLLALANAEQKAADIAERAAEDKTVFEASIAKLKARIAEFEAAAIPDEPA